VLISNEWPVSLTVTGCPIFNADNTAFFAAGCGWDAAVEITKTEETAAIKNRFLHAELVLVIA
jgi:hypothetical protein